MIPQRLPLLVLALVLVLRLEAAPNILFIMSDDHTTQAVGAYGSRLAALDPTPNIDRLAEAGMRFDRVFCTNSICTPSRASILTGQYPQTNGVLDLGGRIPPEQKQAAATRPPHRRLDHRKLSERRDETLRGQSQCL